MIHVQNNRAARKHIFITKWPDKLERYVKYDKNKDDYFEVNLADAQKFASKEEAENFAAAVEDFGYDKPEVVTVECCITA
ncbi:MAG: hypothetical protein N3B21_11750 [Clostridia bacterium]|nr:hypothetical protein [Clostridia bacterium]